MHKKSSPLCHFDSQYLFDSKQVAIYFNNNPFILQMEWLLLTLKMLCEGVQFDIRDIENLWRSKMNHTKLRTFHAGFRIRSEWLFLVLHDVKKIIVFPFLYSLLFIPFSQNMFYFQGLWKYNFDTMILEELFISHLLLLNSYLDTIGLE